MEGKKSILLGFIFLAISAVIGGYQLRRGIEETGRAIERAVEAIHTDIKHSQEKIEGKIKRERY